MVKNVTTWSPDTCGCVINYEWDTELSEDERTHQVTKIKKQCSAHAGKSKDKTFEFVKEENATKNIAVAEALAMKKDMKAADIGWTFETPSSRDVSNSESHPRKMTLILPSVYSNKEKKAVRAKIEGKLGLGKVTLG